MEYRQVGKSGLRVSSVSIGGWLTIGGSIDGETSNSILHASIEAGINFIDVADIYARGESERVVGSFLREYCSGAGRSRSDLVVSSKVFWPMSSNPNDEGLSRKHILESIDKSLKRLGTDYVDLYFAHRYDDRVPLEETVRAMDDLVRWGKVIYWGTSCWTAEQLRAAHDLCERRGYAAPTVEQPEYSLLHRDIERDGVRDAASELGMGLVVWSPLAQGMLTGKYNAGVPEGSRGQRTDWMKRFLNEPNVARVRRLTEVAAELGHSPGVVALSWLLHQPGVTSVITGATRRAHVETNVAAAALALDESQQRRISEIFAE